MTCLCNHSLLRFPFRIRHLARPVHLAKHVRHQTGCTYRNINSSMLCFRTSGQSTHTLITDSIILAKWLLIWPTSCELPLLPTLILTHRSRRPRTLQRYGTRPSQLFLLLQSRSSLEFSRRRIVTLIIPLFCRSDRSMQTRRPMFP